MWQILDVIDCTHWQAHTCREFQRPKSKIVEPVFADLRKMQCMSCPGSVRALNNDVLAMTGMR
jgi:hypothetical protein